MTEEAETGSRWGRAFRDLGLALVNATLMLAIILTVAGIVLAVKLDRLKSMLELNLRTAIVDTGLDRLSERLPEPGFVDRRLEQIGADIAELREARADDPLVGRRIEALTAELEEIRTLLADLADSRDTVTVAISGAISQGFATVAGELAGCTLPDLAPDLTGPDLTDGTGATPEGASDG
ncbi:hypothetical protein [Oceanomicrobium pacificus]|uniref:Uncharacterized protein n=1 Tax=Oceanomicrobium pacificus TaxID=2692916 RepID=A0A6B0TSR8_9RHOB|nr:hypothetical protein [Oceanomicrobium pacificus]MXU64043.1 hypothetical protein [Oceanomicrobium pacificus]